MDFIDKEHIAFLKIGKKRRDITRFFDGGSCSRTKFRSHFIGDDVCERCLAKSWRACEEDVVERFASSQRSFHVDAQVFFYLTLTNVFIDARRSESQIKLAIVVIG